MVICYSSKRKLIQRGGRNWNGWSSGERGPVLFLLLFSGGPATRSDFFYPSPESQAGLSLIPPSFLCSSKQNNPALPCTLLPSVGWLLSFLQRCEFTLWVHILKEGLRLKMEEGCMEFGWSLSALRDRLGSWPVWCLGSDVILHLPSLRFFF